MRQLTKTENLVAHNIANGYLGKEIADRLRMSEHTVHAHSRNIRRKLGAKNIADITRMYILSLDNPRLVLKAVFFLILQLNLMATGFCDDFRMVRTTRIVRVSGRKNNLKKQLI